MNSRTIPITLYGEQATILHDWLNTDLNCIDIIHAGAGKTFLAALALPIFATDTKYHKGKDILYLAPTTHMIKSLVWENLKKTCMEYYGLIDGKDINNSDLTIKFPNGVFIRCKSAELKENLRGLNAGIAVLDEAALYSEEALQEITNRLRPIPGRPETEGRLIVISTPNGAGPLYQLYKQALEQPEKFIVRHYDYTTMRSGNRTFIERQRSLLSPMKFASDYMCSFENVEDQFWYTWNAARHTAPTYDDGVSDLVAGFDFNKRVMTSVVGRIVKDQLHILKAYAIKNCGTEGMAQAIRQDFPRRRINAVIDMSGSQLNRDTTSPFGITDKTILEKYGFTIVNSRNSNPLISDTDNICNAFVNQDRLIIPPEEAQLIEALNTYHFEDGTRKKLVKYTEANYAHIDGLSDALRYLITHYFPIRHAESQQAEYVGMDPRYQNRMRPGIEHMPYSPLFPGGPTMEEIINPQQDEDYMTWS